MNILPRHLFSCSAVVLLAFLLWLPCRPATAATIAQVAAALDNPAGVTFTKMEYWKYKMEKITEDGEISYELDENTYTVSSGDSKWAVQTKTANTTTPVWGGSCIYSTGVEDGAAARLYLKVRGPGTLTFLYKTSCDDSDAFNVYVDGELVQNYSGFGDDIDWEEEEITLNGGRSSNEAYIHEIVFEYFKNEPEYDGKTKIPDGPRRDDYDTTAEYNAAKAYFHDCIWLDLVVWAPAPVDIDLDPNPNPINDEEPPEVAALRGVFIDSLVVNVPSNSEEFGYHIRYTTDGTTPTANSPAYVIEDGILLTSTCTVKAKVFDTTAGGAPFAVVPEVMASGTFQAKAATPNLAIDEDASTPNRILCTAATTTPDAVIFYTLTPDAVPNLPWPAGGLVVTKPSQIRAIAKRANTLDSELASLAVTQATAPNLAIDEDASTPDSIVCTAATTTPDAAIFYTLTPGAVPNLPWPAGGLIVTKPSQIRALARSASTLDSAIASLAILQAKPPVITAQADGQPLSPQAKAYTPGATLTITIAAPSGNALYATSAAPGAAWTPYTIPLVFRNCVDAVTILARSITPGGLASAIVQVAFYPADTTFTFGDLGSGFALHDGWNLLGMPISPTQETMAALLAAWPIVFAIEPTTETLCRPNWIAQGEGFWLYCDQDAPRTLAIRGAILPDTVSQGWRLLTPTIGAERVEAWHWSTPEGAYRQQKLLPGQGGWKYLP